MSEKKSDFILTSEAPAFLTVHAEATGDTTVSGDTAGQVAESLCRDPSRIDVVLDEIRSYWIRNPSLRLAQIVGNAASRAGFANGGYGMEDDVLLNNLRSVQLRYFDFNRGRDYPFPAPGAEQ